MLRYKVVNIYILVIKLTVLFKKNSLFSFKSLTIILALLLTEKQYVFGTNTTTNSFSNTEHSLIYEEKVFDKNIRSILCHRKGWDISPPSIELNSNQQLIIKFDEIGENYTSYSYKIVHCNSDWEASNISEADYLSGFYENQITNYTFSVNTTIPYVHYELELPNKDVQLTISGNYAFIVYKNFDFDNPAFIQHFYVYENKVNIESIIKRPSLAQYMDNGQQVELTINHPGFEISDPTNDIQVHIYQNENTLLKKTNVKPVFIRNNQLVYSNIDENIFLGLNEFRFFNTSNLRYQSANIYQIDFNNNAYDVVLYADKSRRFDNYVTYEDLNGRFSIDLQNSDYNDTEADYSYVHFTFPIDYPLDNKDIYIVGGFNRYGLSEENKMDYHFNEKEYRKNLLLKQGYYNYMYVILDKVTGKTEFIEMEGSHFSTENNYSILIYYQGFGDRYQRLIGYDIINTHYRNQ